MLVIDNYDTPLDNSTFKLLWHNHWYPASYPVNYPTLTPFRFKAREVSRL